jgi:H+-translocating NAD(P) transhydrogenase subunit alpha
MSVKMPHPIVAATERRGGAMPPRLVRVLLLPALAAALSVSVTAQTGPKPSTPPPASVPAAKRAVPGKPAAKAQPADPAQTSQGATAPSALEELNPPARPASKPATHAAPSTGLNRSRKAAAPENRPPLELPPDVAARQPQRAVPAHEAASPAPAGEHAGGQQLDFISMLFVFMLATFIGVGVIMRVSRLLHTPLMSLTNAISAIAVVGSIVLAGSGHYPNNWYHFWGAVALFASMTNIVSGFLITDRMLKMFKTREGGK